MVCGGSTAAGRGPSFGLFIAVDLAAGIRRANDRKPTNPRFSRNIRPKTGRIAWWRPGVGKRANLVAFAGHAE